MWKYILTLGYLRSSKDWLSLKDIWQRYYWLYSPHGFFQVPRELFGRTLLLDWRATFQLWRYTALQRDASTHQRTRIQPATFSPHSPILCNALQSLPRCPAMAGPNWQGSLVYSRSCTAKLARNGELPDALQSLAKWPFPHQLLRFIPFFATSATSQRFFYT
jgi:hypothetical protein